VKNILMSAVLALVLVTVMVAPAMADDQTDIGAQVEVTGYASVTITDTAPGGLSFGSMTPGQDLKAEAASPSASIIITAGSENNQDVTIEISGLDFENSGATESFAIANAYWNTSNDSGTATYMKETLVATDVVATLGASDVVSIYHWLSIPEGQAPDTYTSAFTYKSDATEHLP
jgi:hypothetical protein